MNRKWLFLVLLVPAVAGADEVYLKGGGKVSGRVVQRTATSVEVDVGAGKITVPADRVEQIEERRSPLDDYYDRVKGRPRRVRVVVEKVEIDPLLEDSRFRMPESSR